MEIAFRSIAAQFAEGLARAKNPGRPIELRVKPGERAEKRPSQRARYGRAQRFLAAVKEIALIARKEFVAAVAGQRNLHRAPRKLRKPVGWKSRTVAEGLIEDARQSRDGSYVVALHGFNELAQAVTRGDGLGVGALVHLRFIESDGKAAHRVGHCLRHQRRDGARIDAAREKRTDRNVGDKLRFDRGGEPLAQFACAFLQTASETLSGSRLPVTIERQASAAAQGERMAGFKLLRARQKWCADR